MPRAKWKQTHKSPPPPPQLTWLNDTEQEIKDAENPPPAPRPKRFYPAHRDDLPTKPRL